MEYRAWKPEGEIRAIVQIAHGMAEHIDRYDRLARALNAQGYLVIGHNHRGHGEHAERLGYFADRNGWALVVQDLHDIMLDVKQRYPGKKTILLGHSMGSFAAREYALRYPMDLDALVLSGTGWYGKGMCWAGRFLAALMPPKKPSKLVDRIAFSANNKPFRPARTAFDWLSRDVAEVDRYINDPLCGFVFTGRAFRDFFGGLIRLTDLSRLERMEKPMPVCFLSGQCDPVGQMGKGVQKVFSDFEKFGMRDVTVRLYSGARHELFNEINRDEVTNDLVCWLNEHIG